MNLRRLLGLAIFLAIGLTVCRAADAGAFTKGTTAYEQGDFATAAQVLQEESTRRVSAGLLHNLGNARFKLNQLGPAILAWEQARALDPSLRNATANLHFARNQAGLEEPSFSWAEKYSALLPPDAWTWIVVLAFWAAVGLLTLPPLLRRRRTAATQACAVVAIGFLLLALPALIGIAARNRLGVILTAETILRLTPTYEGELVAKLAEGELARTEQMYGEYVYVRASGDRAGWVKHSEFARIWP